MGDHAIAKALNAEKVPTPAFGYRGRPAVFWNWSYITKVLQSAAVGRAFEPHEMDRDAAGKTRRVKAGPAIEGYFPAVVGLD